MRPPAVLDELPSGWLVEREPRAWLAWRAELESELRAAGYGPTTDGERAASELAGRRPLEDLVTARERYVVRRFVHGGLLRVLTGERFADAERPFRELLLAERLASAGVRTPEVVAARAQAAPGGGFRLEIVTRRLAGTLDLGRVLARARAGEVERRALRRIARAFGELVARLHALGFVHADLQLNNVLVAGAALEGAEPELAIVDLDRSEIVATLEERRRVANLARLHRFVERREQRDGRALARTDRARFLAGYERDRARRRDLARAVLAVHARGRGWHALGWGIERAIAPQRAPRR